ncbi:MAG TPA: hypothetical protein VFP63_03100 [Dehalococcoidia bacterium]|nr:hypothetical protein [Dehalococcoidia bacterium]
MTRSGPMEFKEEADEALERAANRLRGVLKEAASRLDPFPPFPGAFFSYGIEIDAPAVHLPDVGCVVLGRDGELYELKLGQSIPALDMEISDPVAIREEELKALDLHPRDYLVFGYNALVKVVELLLEREAQGEKV